MKLFLTSHDPGGPPSDLAAMVGDNRRVAIVANANDANPVDTRAAGVAREIAELASIGLLPEELDLRKYFDTTRDLRGALSKFGLVWVQGGNAFLLRRAMRYSRLDWILPDLLHKTDLVYGGYSAGAVAAAPTLHGIELVDDPRDAPAPYLKEVVWTGLNLVPYHIAPHYRSVNSQVRLIEDAVAYFIAHGMPYRTLSDGQTILVDGDDEWMLDLRSIEAKALELVSPDRW